MTGRHSGNAGADFSNPFDFDFAGMAGAHQTACGDEKASAFGNGQYGFSDLSFDHNIVWHESHVHKLFSRSRQLHLILIKMRLGNRG